MLCYFLLYNKVNQMCMYMCVYTPPFFWISFPFGFPWWLRQ